LNQAPVHTDSLTIYKTELRIIPTEEGEGAEIRRRIVKATEVVEQRVSHFLMGLAIIGTMTGPLLIVLHTMPTAVFAGVFFIVGVCIFSAKDHFSPVLFVSLTADGRDPISNLLTVGFHRIQRYLIKMRLSHERKPLHSARRASSHCAQTQNPPVCLMSDDWCPRFRGYLSDNRCNW
jgi:hypothetical protein